MPGFMIYFLLSMLSGHNKNGLLLKISVEHNIWTDSTGMNLRIVLTNSSSDTVELFDQLLGSDVSLDNSPFLSNLTFYIEKLEGEQYVYYKDRPYADYFGQLDRPLPLSFCNVLDSIKLVRNPCLTLLPRDSAFLIYTFSRGRRFIKGEYRVRGRYLYGCPFGKDRKWIESDWAYFSVREDLLYAAGEHGANTYGMPVFWKMK